MTRADHCRQLTWGHDPHATLQSLMRVLRWLDELPG
jgi:hypothetical protein